jgi:glycosyltransferase involved in cell wall biosynthesis
VRTTGERANKSRIGARACPALGPAKASGKRRSGPVKVVTLALAPFPYHADLYRALAMEPQLEFSALFCSNEGIRPRDGGFGNAITWDSDLVGGYSHTFLPRANKNHFEGKFFSLRDWDVIRVIRREKPEVLWIHNYNYLTLVLAALTQRLSGGAVAFRGDFTLLVDRPLWKRAIKSASLPLLFNGSYGLHSGSEAKHWMRKYGIPDARLVFVPMSIDNSAFQRRAKELRPNRDAFKRDFGLPEGYPTILFVGRLVEMKQPLLLLDAFARVRAKCVCSLLVVGSGPLEQAMRQQVDDLGVPDVHFAGFLNQSRISEAYTAADVLALPSDANESWGLVVNEAMNHELPVVVSTEVACGPDLVHPGETGYIVSTKGPDDLAQKLLSLTLDSELRQRLGANALKTIDKWGIDATVAGVLAAARLMVGEERWARAESPSPPGA